MPTTTHRPNPPDRPSALEALRPEWLTNEHWPFPITELRHGEHRLAVTDTGGEGPTVLLVHVGMSSFVWRDVLLELGTDFRCVTFDAPGTGLTTGPGDVTINDAADAIDAVVRQLDLRGFVLVFHDLGGPASLEAASRWPDQVKAIAAINTFGWRPSGFAFRGMLALMGNVAMRELDVLTGWLPRLTSTRFGVGLHWPRSTRRTFRRMLGHRGRRSLHRYMASVRNHDFATIEATVTKLGGLPMYTVFGERNDPLGFQPRWAERFSDLTQVEVPNGNHFPMCDDPKLVAHAISGAAKSPPPHQTRRKAS